MVPPTHPPTLTHALSIYPTPLITPPPTLSSPHPQPSHHPTPNPLITLPSLSRGHDHPIRPLRHDQIRGLSHCLIAFFPRDGHVDSCGRSYDSVPVARRGDRDHTSYQHTVNTHTLSIHPINPLSQPPYQHTHCQHTLSIHPPTHPINLPINLPYQNTLSKHPLTTLTFVPPHPHHLRPPSPSPPSHCPRHPLTTLFSPLTLVTPHPLIGYMVPSHVRLRHECVPRRPRG